MARKYTIIGGGEPTVHKEPEAPGAIIKAARQKADITMEKLAEKVGITERYLYRIENEGQKPSYDVFIKLIRELAIDPRLIVYPELDGTEDEIGEVLRMLCTCDKRSLEVAKATIRALHDTAPKM
jgi:transcriptional regulator with XRE-family HTH domain